MRWLFNRSPKITLEDFNNVSDNPEVRRMIYILKSSTSSEQYQERVDAVNELARIRDKSAVPFLIEALSDKSGWVIAAAARALGEFGDNSAIPALVKRLLSSPTWDLDQALDGWIPEGSGISQVEAAKALRKLGDTSATQGLIKKVSGWETRDINNAILLLGYLGDTSAVPHLVEQTLSDKGGYSAYAIVSLRQINDPTVVSMLVEALSSSNQNTRLKAVQALSELGDESIVPELIKSLSDDHSQVRGHTISALSDIGGALAIKALTDALSHWDSIVRQDAQAALHRLDIPMATVYQDKSELNEEPIAVEGEKECILCMTRFSSKARRSYCDNCFASTRSSIPGHVHDAMASVEINDAEDTLRDQYGIGADLYGAVGAYLIGVAAGIKTPADFRGYLVLNGHLNPTKASEFVNEVLALYGIN